jgi:hypothetical protein
VRAFRQLVASPRATTTTVGSRDREDGERGGLRASEGEGREGGGGHEGGGETPLGMCVCGGGSLQNAASLAAPAGGEIVLPGSAFCICISIWRTC